MSFPGLDLSSEGDAPLGGQGDSALEAGPEHWDLPLRGQVRREGLPETLSKRLGLSLGQSTAWCHQIT